MAHRYNPLPKLTQAWTALGRLLQKGTRAGISGSMGGEGTTVPDLKNPPPARRSKNSTAVRPPKFDIEEGPHRGLRHSAPATQPPSGYAPPAAGFDRLMMDFTEEGLPAEIANKLADAHERAEKRMTPPCV